MNTKMIVAALAGAALSMAASTASAGTLTNVSVTLSDNRVSQPTDVTVRFTTATALSGGATPGYGDYVFVTNRFEGITMVTGPCNGDVVVRIDGVALPASALDNCMLTISGFVQVQLKPGQSVPAGSDVEITVDKARMTTTSVSGIYATQIFRTAIYVGNIIDSPAAEPTYSIVAPPPPVPVPTLTEWAMIMLTAGLGGLAALTIHRRRRTV